MRILCNSGASTSGNTALSIASRRGEWDMVAYLISMDADTEEGTEGESGRRHVAPILLAAHRAEWAVVLHLAACGADTSATDARGEAREMIEMIIEIERLTLRKQPMFRLHAAARLQPCRIVLSQSRLCASRLESGEP